MAQTCFFFVFLGWLILLVNRGVADEPIAIIAPAQSTPMLTLAARETVRYVYLRTGHLLPLQANDKPTGNADSIVIAVKSSPILGSLSLDAKTQHLAPPYWERLLVDAKLIQNAQQFHFRPFNGHHCQVPVTNGHGKLSTERKQWLTFLEKTLALWLKGNQAGRELFVVPEMGPVRGGYNFEQLPTSWEDAKVLRPLVAQAWQKALTSK